MATVTRIPTSPGQVPPIQDRAHRLFLSRILDSLETLKSSLASASSTSTGEISALRTQLLGLIEEINQRIDDIEGGQLYTRLLAGLVVTVPLLEHGITTPSFASVRKGDGAEVSVAIQITAGSDVVVSSLVPLDGHVLYLR